jgi:hypothetical protein
MRIIFVGLHNKPDRMPLDILTKTGKLINRVIRELPKGIKIVKSNLFDVDEMPNPKEEYDLMTDWGFEHQPTDDDIIVLLGAYTHKVFKFRELAKIIKVAHPASKRSHKEVDEYVMKVSNLIKEKICLIKK